MDLPVEGAKERGIVRRLEPYGAFVELERFPRLRGLVHISEMAEYRVEKPDDVVSCEDVVWVKVLSVKTEEVDGRVRHRIQLSMKNVDNNDSAQQLESNLSSTIGMGFAEDPMSHLIMKHEPSGTMINGYALVDADEGEPDRPQVADDNAPRRPMGRGRGSTLPAWMTRENGAQSQGLLNEAPKPMGRGRGATLPAWMTRGDGPMRAGEETPKSNDSRHEEHHQEHHREEKKKHSRKHVRDRDDSRHDKKHRQEKDRRHSPSGSDTEKSRSRRRGKKHHGKDFDSRRHSDSGSNRDEPRESRHSKKHHRRKSKDCKSLRRRDSDSEELQNSRHCRKHHRRDHHVSRRHSDSGSGREEPRDSRRSRKHHRREDHVSRRRSSGSGSVREEPRDSKRSRKHHRREDRESRRRSDSGSGREEPRNSRRSRKHQRREDRESRRLSRSRDSDLSGGRDSRLRFSSVEEAKELIAELEWTRRSRRDSEGSDNGKPSHAHRGNDTEAKRLKRRRRDSRDYSSDSGREEFSRHGRHVRKGSDHTW